MTRTKNVLPTATEIVAPEPEMTTMTGSGHVAGTGSEAGAVTGSEAEAVRGNGAGIGSGEAEAGTGEGAAPGIGYEGGPGTVPATGGWRRDSAPPRAGAASGDPSHPSGPPGM